MPILTKAQLEALNQSSFPDQSTEAITPAILRTYNTQTIDTLVDSLDTGSFATSAITGSSLITASASGTNVITFTKGNGTTFGVTIATGSGGGGTTDLTSLNAFTSSQDTKNSTLASYTSSVDTKFATIGTQSGSWGGGGTDITSLNAFTQSQNTKDVTLASYTASVDTKFSNIGSQSGSWDNTNLNSFTQSVDTKFIAVGSSTASLNSFTSSQETKNSTLATYTGSNDTKWSNLGSQSGSFVTESETGSFARTNIDNNFSANQTFTNITAVSASFTYLQTLYETSSVIYSSGSNQFGDELSDIQTLSGSVKIQGNLTINGTPVQTSSVDISALNSYTQSQDTKNSTLATYTGSNDTKWNTLSSQSGSWITEAETGSYATTGSNTFTGGQTINGGNKLFIQRSAGGANNVLRLGATDNENNFAFIVTGSDTNPGQQVWGINVGGGIWANSFDAGVVFNSSVLATGMTSKHLTLIDTADNASSISGASGSLLLTAKGFTSSSAHISASTATQVNLIFKNNSNTGDTILSGSNNIFVNPAAVTAGFKRYLGGSGNIVLSTNTPQISGSMGFSPTMNNNFWNGTGASLLARGPVSSSAWTISNNIVNNQAAWSIGTAAATDAKQMISGFSGVSNIGSVFPAITAYKTPLSASVTFTTNTGTGQVSMNCDSSSMSFASNGHFGSTTINNSYFPATINNQTGLISLSSNTLVGTSIINASGSDTTFTAVAPRGAFNNVIGGFSTIGLVLNGDNSSLNSSAVIGGGLVVTGSNSKQASATANADWGSAFFGRWNAQDGNRAISGPTVFAVGTGTSTSARKTGFLIDSGSNTFIEGTLNVSGSTTITGSLNVTSLIVSGSTQFNVGAFNSTITQSGSAAVSQSMTFNNTDITQGVTLNGGGTQLTLTNSGTYNIQFSTQLLAATGQDDIYIWLKKNGTNVSNTATKLVLANNEASVAAWNFVVPASGGDYFELAWQSRDGHTLLSAATATGNIPAIPSVIVTVTQVR